TAPARTDIYTLSLHDALPIWRADGPPAPWTKSTDPTERERAGAFPPPGHTGRERGRRSARVPERLSPAAPARPHPGWFAGAVPRSEEHTSELQSRFDLVCRLL